jgi:thiamine-phosphate pyrophosphorylase
LKKEVKSIYKDKFFELIVFSSPLPLDQEFSHVNQMFAEGLECFHLRKPAFSKQTYLSDLQQIKPEYLKRVMVHDHYGLALKYNIKGLHIKKEYFKNNPEEVVAVIKAAKKRGLKISTGIHSSQELESLPTNVDYVYWSPVFDSISKAGYKGNVDLKKAEAILKTLDSKSKIVALGGIDLDKIKSIEETGFDGAAILGALWQSDFPFQKFKQFKRLI